MDIIVVAMVLSGPFYILVFQLLRWLKRDKPDQIPIVTQLGDQLVEVRLLCKAAAGLLTARTEAFVFQSGVGPTSKTAMQANMPDSVLNYINLESEEWARDGMMRLATELYDEIPIEDDSERWAKVLSYLKLQEGE